MSSIAVLCLLLGGQATTQAPLHLKAIIADEEPELRVSNRVVGRMKDLVCTIERVEGVWFWVRTTDGKEGWIKANEVVLFSMAIEYFTQRIREDPSDTRYYQRRAVVWEDMREIDLALADMTEAIRREPFDAPFRNTRGNLYYDKKDYDRALADYNEALRLDPNDAFVWYNAGSVRHDKGDLEKAISNFTRAIALDPNFPLPFVGRASTWKAQGAFAQALADYGQAIRLDPKNAETHNSRAWLLATCPDDKVRDGKLAMNSARRACELSDWKDASYIDTLAAAYAEVGDFEKASQHQRQAVELATPELRTALQDRLALYQDKKPYREVSAEVRTIAE